LSNRYPNASVTKDNKGIKYLGPQEPYPLQCGSGSVPKKYYQAKKMYNIKKQNSLLIFHDLYKAIGNNKINGK